MNQTELNAENIAYIGLGSNLDAPLRQITTAIKAIDLLPDTTVLAKAPIYKSKPVGPQDQPDFYNTAIKVSTSSHPEMLLKLLQHIEITLGRVKKRHWGERCIDLDILLFNNEQVNLPHLTIPHAEIRNRDFVLKPLLDICQDLTLPDGKPLRDLLQQCPCNHLQPVPSPAIENG
jgi:2-amino-4-hydroxy-6-hydroxymethyldihydropteridine diphosphokinase